jgi:ecotin
MKNMKPNSELEKELANFPKAKKGWDRWVILVDSKAENEPNFQVEIIVGKKMMIDCNQHFMMGKIVERELKGWGYVYYEVESNGLVGSTKMACMEDKKTESLVSMPSVLTRYNSRLPIVIYVPKGMEVRYKLWQTGHTMKSAEIK